MTKTPYFTSIVLGNIVKDVVVGRKHVLTVLVPDYYLSKRTGKSEVDSYQINLFETDYQRLSVENEDFISAMDTLSKGGTAANMEIDIKITMSKPYTNTKGQWVFPHPEFKFVDIRQHRAVADIISNYKNEVTELEATFSEEVPF